jgi:hypothetical protein
MFGPLLGLLAVLPALSLSLVTAGCGGSEATPPRDGGVGGAGGSGAGGGGSTGTASGGGGASGGSLGGGGAGGAGGTGSGAGGTGGVAAGGSAGGVDAAAGADGAAPKDAPADLPSLPFDGFPADGFTLGDSGLMIVQCPVDVATATCTTGLLCVKPSTGGPAEGCGCTQAQRWFCPGITLGGDGGVSPPDSGTLPDAAGVAACPAGTATGAVCTSVGDVCTGGTGHTVGCGCLMGPGGLRWACL